MKHITQTGATVEKAVESALEQLQATRDQVTVEVIQQEKKGFFGFGAKEAEVIVTVNEEPARAEPELPQKPEVPAEEPAAEMKAPIVEEAVPQIEEAAQQEETEGEGDRSRSLDEAIEKTKDYIQSVAGEMGIHDLTIAHEMAGKQANFYLESEKVALLIGKRGNTLNSLQQLAQLVANKHARQFLIVQLDAENYRERRQETLEQLADRMADKAIHTGSRVQFEPMPSYERKVIHQSLSRRMDIDTYSEGKEPNRYLVIEPLNE